MFNQWAKETSKGLRIGEAFPASGSILRGRQTRDSFFLPVLSSFLSSPSFSPPHSLLLFLLFLFLSLRPCFGLWSVTEVGLELAIFCLRLLSAGILSVPHTGSRLDTFYWAVFKLGNCLFLFSCKCLLKLPSALKRSVLKFLVSAWDHRHVSPHPVPAVLVTEPGFCALWQASYLPNSVLSYLTLLLLLLFLI